MLSGLQLKRDETANLAFPPQLIPLGVNGRSLVARFHQAIISNANNTKWGPETPKPVWTSTHTRKMGKERRLNCSRGLCLKR